MDTLQPLLAHASAALSPLGQQLDQLETFLLDMVDPTGATRAVTEGWWLADLRSAGYVAIGYLVCVLFASTIFKMKFVPAIDPYVSCFFCFWGGWLGEFGEGREGGLCVVESIRT